MKFTSPKYTLIKTSYDGNKIEHEFKAETLMELLANIENFIRGSGFYVEGERLDFVSEKDEDVFQLSDYTSDLGIDDNTITLTGAVGDMDLGVGHVDIDVDYDIKLDSDSDSFTINLDDTYGTTTSFLDEKLK